MIAGRLQAARAQAPHLAPRDREATTNSIIVETLGQWWLLLTFVFTRCSEHDQIEVGADSLSP